MSFSKRQKFEIYNSASAHDIHLKREREMNIIYIFLLLYVIRLRWFYLTWELTVAVVTIDLLDVS